MSTTQAIVGEFDVVALVEAVDGWPPGTKGAVIFDHPDFKLVEIANDLGETLDELAVSEDQLRLVGKYLKTAVD